MSGEVGDPLAPGVHLPRALMPGFLNTVLVTGPEIALGADRTNQLHQMVAFYTRPRITSLGVEEVYRRSRPRGKYYPGVVSPFVDRVGVMFDDHGRIDGAVPIPEPVLAERGLLNKTSLIEAFRSIGVLFTRPRCEEELRHLYAEALRIFGLDTEFSRRTGRTNTIERMLIPEDALRIIELLELYPDVEARSAVFTLCQRTSDKEVIDSIIGDYRGCGDAVVEAALSAGSRYENLLQLCDTRDELLAAACLARKKPSWVTPLMVAYDTLAHDTATSGDDPTKFLWEMPFANSIFMLGRDLIKNALFHHDDTSVPLKQRETYLRASFDALYDVLNTLHGLDLPARLPKEQTMFKGLADFATMHADDAIALSLISPVVEQFFLLKLKRIIPGKFEAARDYFYKAIGTALNAHSNEATGDDELQLSLQTDVLEELVRLGYWHSGDIWQDAAAGSGDRILRRSLDSRVMKENLPGTVYATDALAFSQPDDHAWIAVQAQFEDDAYPMIHAKYIGKDGIVPIQLITSIWSSANDVGADKQQVMFEHFALSLKKREGDIPGGVLVLEVPIGYIKEMIEFADARGRREMGEVMLQYPVGGGETLDKPLEIMKMHDLLIRAMRAGFRPLNLPPGKGEVRTPAFYRTGAGKDRAILVFERVGDPEPTLDQVFVGSGRPDRRA